MTVQVGDIVECWNAGSMDGYLTKGRVYQVNSVGMIEGGQTISIHNDVGKEGEYHLSRFKPVKSNRDPAFWLVKGRGPTSYEHISLQAAEKEADRLARTHIGETFTVLGPIKAFTKSDMQVTDLTHYLEQGEQDVPF